MKFTRLRTSRSAMLPILFLVLAMVFWPVMDSVRNQSTSAQSVDWLSTESSNYLTSSSGIPVWVPGWLPGEVAGVAPEIYAGGGSYSIYFYSGSSFLYVTGVAGAGFPGGSEANLNVPLEINTSVAGYSAIQDIGIPEGSDTPIYDKTMWIAGGVLYTVNTAGLSTDSVTLANSSVVLAAAAPEPAPTDPPVVEEPWPTDPPVEVPVDNGGGDDIWTDTSETFDPTATVPVDSTGTATEESEGVMDEGIVESSDEPINTESEVETEPVSTGTEGSDGTGGPWFPGSTVGDIPSDGSAGPVPPHINRGDGTGGAP